MGTEIVAVYTCDKSCIKKSPMYVNGQEPPRPNPGGVEKGAELPFKVKRCSL